MLPDDNPPEVAKASCALRQLVRTWTTRGSKKTSISPLSRLPQTSIERLDTARATDGVQKEKTVLYLAYGSNLSNETFRGNRGIKPLSQINVQVPSLRLTFDLPGIPYAEPCFANSGTRDPEKDIPHATPNTREKAPLLDRDAKYHKDEWHKGLVGVVYEVTSEDYAHIIATEGGGASYHDILVDCHPFESIDPAAPVPVNPTLSPFKAHTLFAPATAPGDKPDKDGGRLQRPDTSYAQPSARYLKLITDGAAELGLPNEYQEYLHALKPYTITTNKQRMGQFLFASIWLPIVLSMFQIGRMFADEDGRLPVWVQKVFSAVFAAVWFSYDGFFLPVFGDGERSIPDGGHTLGFGGRRSVGVVEHEKGLV